jgi:hypothetical protein
MIKEVPKLRKRGTGRLVENLRTIEVVNNE